MPRSLKRKLTDLLVDRGLFATADEAARAVWAGEVIVGDQMVDSPSALVPEDAEVRLRGKRGRYVSRGGNKLEAALARFGVGVEGRVALDVGASTGGFTDCLLAHGAARVYAVEAGRGQLAQRLQLDERVVDLGGHDVMELSPSVLDPAPDLAAVDVTFLSLADVLPRVWEMLCEPREVVALVKPLFEARLAGIGRVQDVQRVVFKHLLPRLSVTQLPIRNVMASPLLGSGGAVEFFLHIRDPGLSGTALAESVAAALSEGRGLLTRETLGRSLRPLADGRAEQ